MDKEPVSRILKTHRDILSNVDSEKTGAKVSSLAAFLKEALLRNEADLRTVTRWIQSKKRLINREATTLDINNTNRKVLLDEVNHLELLRQQLLTTFLSQQAAYESLMIAERELAKRYEQEKENNNPAPITTAGAPTKAAKKKKSRPLHR